MHRVATDPRLPVESPLAQMTQAYLDWAAFFVAGALLYASTALVAAVALWRMKPWAANAFLAWSIAVLAEMCAISVAWGPHVPGFADDLPRKVLAMVLFGMFTALLLAAGWLYVRKVIATATRPRATGGLERL